MGHGPWSVKGIDPKARAKARERAQRDGITLGTYLNRLLLEDGAANDSNVAESLLKPILRGQESPERVSEIAATLEEISRRMHVGENRSTQAMAGIDQSMLTLLNRLEASEQSQAGIVGRVDEALSGVRATQASFEERLDSLSRKDNSHRMLEAMRALEGALSKLAKQVDSTQDQAAADHIALRDITSRVDRSLGDGQRKIDDTVNRIDRLERSTDDRLRDVLGRTENALDLARSQGRKSEERLNDIEDKISSVHRKADSASKHARASVDELTDHLKSFAAHTDRKLDEALSTADLALERSQRTLEDISAATQARNQELADSLFGKIDSVEKRLDSAQQNVTSMFAKVSEVGTKVDKVEREGKSSEDALATLQAAMERINERLENAETAKAGVITDLENSYTNLEERFDTVQKQVGDTANLKTELEEKLAAIEASVEATVANKQQDLHQQLQTVQSDISSAEERQIQAVELMTGQFERLSEALDERLRAVEDREGTDYAVDSVRDELNRATDAIHERLTNIESSKNAQITAIADQIGKLAEHMEDRLEGTENRLVDSERRNAEAIEQVGEHVARTSERLKARNEESLATISSKIDDVAEQTHRRLSDTMEDIERRLNEAQLASQSLSSNHDTVSDQENGTRETDADFDEGHSAPPFDSHESPLPEASFDEEEFGTYLEDTNASDEAFTATDYSDEQTLPFIDEEFEADTPELRDEDIASMAYDARREFAAELAEQRSSLENEAMMFEEEEPKAVFGSTPSTQDAETDAFTSSMELEYEVDLPQQANSSFMRSDIGADDDPFAKAGSNSIDFLKGARQAAQERGTQNRSIITGNDERKGNKLPIVAAGVLAVAVAGGAGMMMRGKQVNSDDGFATTPPTFNPNDENTAADSAYEEDLFDAEEDVVQVNSIKHEAGVEVDEQLLFPEDAKILNSDTLEAASHDPSIDASNVKKVSALDAFASERTNTPAPKPTSLSLDEAVEAGNPVAQYEKAIKLLASGQKRQAAEMMRLAADQGLAIAQYRMGKLYERGEGVARSIKESRKWTKQAAENGNVKAMHDLAVFYAEGEGGDQSFLSAVEWFTRAAEFGLLDSQYNLGVLYEQGLGVSADVEKAAYWFEVAGRNGDADGLRRARDIFMDIPAADARDIGLKAEMFEPNAVNLVANGNFEPQSWNGPDRSQIAEIQRLLNRIGQYGLDTDGLIGPQTRSAIRAYERQNGLVETGDVSDALLRHIRSSI